MAIPAGELVFLDTDILVAATDESRPFHVVARNLIARGRSAGVCGATSGQVIREYLVVATRPPSANGLGLSPADALRNIEAMTRRLEFCDESEEVSVRLRELVAAGGLRARRSTMPTSWPRPPFTVSGSSRPRILTTLPGITRSGS